MPNRRRRRANNQLQATGNTTQSSLSSAVGVLVEYGPGMFDAGRRVYGMWRGRGAEAAEEAEAERLQREREAAREQIEKERQEHRERMRRIEEEEQERIQKEAENNEKIQKQLSEIKALQEELRRTLLETKVTQERDTPLPAAASEELETADSSPVLKREASPAHKTPEQPASRSSIAEPRFCQQYWSRKGCKKQECQELHLCKLFLAGICKFGDKCRYLHSLDIPHNRMVCTKKGFPVEPGTVHEMQQLFAKKRLAAETFYHKHLELCLRQNSADSCQNCNRIHICRRYVEEACTRQSSCSFGHNLHSPHNSIVLRSHRASELGDDNILDLLYDNSLRNRKGR